MFNSEVTARQNPDFWLCFTKPQGLATGGPQRFMGGVWGAERQLPPLGIRVGDSWSDSCSSLYSRGD